jgi:hypothetical protein
VSLEPPRLSNELREGWQLSEWLVVPALLPAGALGDCSGTLALARYGRPMKELSLLLAHKALGFSHFVN